MVLLFCFHYKILLLKVIIVGGSVAFDTAAANVIEIEDFNQGASIAPVLRTGPSLNNGRKFVLPIILPNGKVVVVVVVVG